MIYKVDNLKGIVQDVGFGKHPAGTFNELTNFDCEYETGSLVSRSGFSIAVTNPSTIGVGGAVVADWFLNSAVNHPSPIDTYLLFYHTSSTRGTFLYPYYHNSSTAINSWIETKDYLVGTLGSSSGNVATFTNIGDALYSTSEDANYYKNWIMIDNSNGNKYFVKSYEYVFNVVDEFKFTLDRTPPANGTSCTFVRYFHTQPVSYFTTYYTTANLNPSCYSSDLAVRWSEGGNSSTQHKNKWAGYLNKTFFNSDTTNKYTFTGTYVDEAECKAPTVSGLGSPTFGNTSIYTSRIANEDDRTFGTINSPTSYHWSPSGTTTIEKQLITFSQTIAGGEKPSVPKDPESIIIGQTLYYRYRTLAVKFGVDGSGGKISLNSSYISSLEDGHKYKFELEYYNPTSLPVILTFDFTGSGISKTVTLKPHDTTNVFFDSISSSFGASSTSTAFNIWSDTATTIYFSYIDVVEDASTNTVKPVTKNSTYALFASYIYDGFQESELVKLTEVYLSSTNRKLTYTLKQDFAGMNKRITAIRTYIDVDINDTTLNINKDYTRYLLSDIPIADSDSGWTFNSGTNTFNYTDTIDGDKINTALQSLTWEQKTNRLATSSTTCSYDIAKFCAGRVFLAREYDYAESKNYPQRVRYTGFNGDGVMCPDIFPNITDRNITYIASGSGTKINALEEFNGSLLITKEGSILELTTSDMVELWRLKVLNNSFASLGKNSILNTGTSIYFCGVDDIMSWGGGSLKSITNGVWKNTYQGLVGNLSNADRFYIVKKKNKDNIEIFPDTTGGGENDSYELNEISGALRKNTYYYAFIGISTTKDNKTYAMSSTGYIFHINKSSTQDVAQPISPSFKTNKIIGEAKSNLILSEIFLTIEGSSGSTISGTGTLTFIGDKTNIQTYTITGSDLTNKIKYYKLKVKPHKPVRFVELQLEGSLVSSAVNGLKIHEYGFEYELVKDSGDVLYT